MRVLFVLKQSVKCGFQGNLPTAQGKPGSDAAQVFPEITMQSGSGYGEQSASLDECTCNDTEDIEKRRINKIFETVDDTKEELEQTLKVYNRDASCYHKITRQEFLSAGTLLLRFLVRAAYFFSNFWVRREPEHCSPALPD